MQVLGCVTKPTEDEQTKWVWLVCIVDDDDNINFVAVDILSRGGGDGVWIENMS